MAYEDILYDARDGVAWLTINRPEVRNAFRAKTVDELIKAFRAAWADPEVGVVVLTGGGHVLHVLCDLTIAADTAVFGQTGPRVGSVDPGFGTAYLARIVGEKKAREIWYLCRQYSAQEALQMGLVNKVVPAAQLRAEVEQWCRELLEKSPTALRLAKQSFNADTEHIAGITELGFSALELYYQTDEALEGRNAFLEKRPPRFRK